MQNRSVLRRARRNLAYCEVRGTDPEGKPHGRARTLARLDAKIAGEDWVGIALAEALAIAPEDGDGGLRVDYPLPVPSDPRVPVLA